jgi:hypothetical protein
MAISCCMVVFVVGPFMRNTMVGRIPSRTWMPLRQCRQEAQRCPILPHCLHFLATLPAVLADSSLRLCGVLVLAIDTSRYMLRTVELALAPSGSKAFFISSDRGEFLLPGSPAVCIPPAVDHDSKVTRSLAHSLKQIVTRCTRFCGERTLGMDRRVGRRERA